MKKMDQTTRIILIHVVAIVLLFGLVCLIALPALHRDPSPEVNEPIETEKNSPKGIVTALPSVESVFEEWQRGKIATEDIAKSLREVHKDAVTDECVGMESVKIYEGEPYIDGASELNQICAEYTIQQAIPMGDDLFAAIQKLQYEGQTVYAYHVFVLKPARLDTALEIERPAYWRLFGTAYMTEGLTLNDFSSLAVDDPCTELFEICPIAKIALSDSGSTAWSWILLPEGLLEVRVSPYDWIKGADLPVSQNAEDYRIYSIQWIPHDESERENLPADMRMNTMLHAFLQTDYILLPE